MYDREGNVFLTLPDEDPVFTTAGQTHYAYGIPACAGMLLELGDVHINVDDGFSLSNYLHPLLADEIARELRYLGANPADYRALRHRDGWV